MVVEDSGEGIVMNIAEAVRRSGVVDSGIVRPGSVVDMDGLH